MLPTTREKAADIVQAIMDDLYVRSGLGDVLGGLDPETEKELIETLQNIVAEKLR